MSNQNNRLKRHFQTFNQTTKNSAIQPGDPSFTVFESYVFNEPYLGNPKQLKLELTRGSINQTLNYPQKNLPFDRRQSRDIDTISNAQVLQSIEDEVRFEEDISNKILQSQARNKSFHNKTRSYLADPQNVKLVEKEFNRQVISPDNFNRRISQESLIVGPNFPHMCQTVRFKQIFNKQLEFTKKRVKQLESQYQGTLKNTRRMKETLNALFGGVTTLQSQQEKYANNMEFIPKGMKSEVLTNGGKPEKYHVSPIEGNSRNNYKVQHNQKVDNLLLFQKVNEDIKRQQDQEILRVKFTQLLKKMHQVPPINLAAQTQLENMFIKRKLSDKREISQNNLKLIKEYEQSNRLGPSFWQNYEQNLKKGSLNSQKRSRNESVNDNHKTISPNYEKNEVIRRIQTTQDPSKQSHYQQNSITKIKSHSSNTKQSDSNRESLYRLRKNQMFEKGGEILRQQLDQNQEKYMISKHSIEKITKQRVKEQQRKIKLLSGGTHGNLDEDDDSGSFNQWGQLSLKKFEMTLI
ncbi:UNKNOWN [Stylonychia lemnae]|uniref:Uncharacterized protein n=1 Tax=Stylonychia lemnae TaxID=5949 RepID=A0A078AHY6_STYLE|nr:UNKNOWN [Stylonychia lemnae]|eukprot:CDW81531.1 UNKNOWN [Stylonychia lemnae]